jgi:DNA-binding beta-propeller fold protein YncE
LPASGALQAPARTLAAVILAAAALVVPAPSSAATTLPYPPSALVLSGDGKTLFVALDRLIGRGGGIAAFARDGDGLRELAHAAVPGGAVSLALTPDGSIAIVATRVGLAAIATAALLDGTLGSVTVVRIADAPRTDQVIVAPDGRYAFATNSEIGTMSVARIARTAAGVPSVEIIGSVPLDRAPEGIAISPDGATIYVTSEVAAGDPAAVPGANDPRLGRTTCALNLGSHGVLSAIDVRTAIADPAHAVTARLAAGCAPARVAVSPDGAIAWVTVRGENRVIAIDTARMRTDPRHALAAEVAVGATPVGLACSRDGSRLLVANSARGSEADEGPGATLSLIDTRAALAKMPALLATIPAGELAREVVAAPDGFIFVTNYSAKTIDVIPPLASKGINPA